MPFTYYTDNFKHYANNFHKNTDCFYKFTHYIWQINIQFICNSTAHPLSQSY